MLKIKPFKEKPGHCGPACLKMILSYYGIEKSEDELAKLCRCTPEEGTTAENLVTAAKKLGLEGFIQDNSDIKDIEKYVENEIPIIIDWFCEDMGHYSVAVGVDEENICLQDGYYGGLITKSIDNFKGVWFDFLGDYITSKDDIILGRMIVLFMKKRSYQKEIVSRLESLTDKFNVPKIGDVKFKMLAYPIYSVIAESPNPNASTLFLSAGVHGDEPAAVYALLEFLEKKIYDYLDYFNFVASPCLNPSGFELDRRKNFDGVDINRNVHSNSLVQEVNIIAKFLANNPKQYLFALDMHEDPTNKPAGNFDVSENPRRFYLYESSPTRKSRMGHILIRELEKLKVPVCKRKEIYNEKNEEGLIWTPRLHNPDYAIEKSIQKYMQRYTTHSFTSETPTCWSLEDRIATHLKLLSIALEKFLPH